MKAIIEFHWCFTTWLCKRLPAGFDSTISLFADDTIAYLVIKSNSDALSLERDLDKLAQWEQLWKIAFHPDFTIIQILSHVVNELYKLSFARSKFAKAMLEEA
jgi:hypothetical protein